MSIEIFYHHAEVNVDASKHLDLTASIIGMILGVEFKLYSSGNYEEFPAYVANKNGLSYALLGFPDEKYDLSDMPRVSYGLHVESIDSCDGAEHLDCSEEIINQILAANKIRVW
jgi:hypothetical protein